MKSYQKIVHVIGNMDPSHGGAQKIVDSIRGYGEANGVFSHHVFAALQVQHGFEGVHNAGIPKTLLPMMMPRRLRCFLKETKADLVHVHSPVVGPWTQAAARRTGVPVVTTLHSTPSKYKRWVWQLERGRLHKDTAIACVSQAVRDDFARYDAWLARDRAQVIHNGIEMMRFAEIASRRATQTEARPAGEPIRILLFGRMDIPKGVDVALRAMSSLVEQERDVLLDLVGEGPELRRLQLLARELGIERRVIFHGSTNNVADYLEACDLCVLPSRWEGFGLTFIEAIGSGVPVVASDIAPFREIFPACRHFVPIEDSDALAQELTRVIEALPAEQVNALEVAQGVRERFDVSQMAQSYMRLYEQVLNAG